MDWTAVDSLHCPMALFTAIEATSEIERLKRDGTSVAHCKQCGAEVTPSAKSCGSCGIRFKGSSNLWLLVIVAIIFGAVVGTYLANFLNR
jgi:uncharacterized paraquat-inducible protein A